MSNARYRVIWRHGVPLLIAIGMIGVGVAGLAGWITFSPPVKAGMGLAAVILVIMGYQTYRSISA